MQRLWKTLWRFLRRLKIYYLAVPLLGLYTDKTIIQKDTCTLVFIAALFPIAKTWKQPKCLISRWMDKESVVHRHNGIFSAINEEWNDAICCHMDRPRDCHTQWSKKGTTPHTVTCIWNVSQMNLSVKQNHRRGEQSAGSFRVGRDGVGGWGLVYVSFYIENE